MVSLLLNCERVLMELHQLKLKKQDSVDFYMTFTFTLSVDVFLFEFVVHFVVVCLFFDSELRPEITLRWNGRKGYTEQLTDSVLQKETHRKMYRNVRGFRFEILSS